MDDYSFSEHLSRFEILEEKTSSLEILNYSDPKHNENELHSLSTDDFPNFVRRAGVFAPKVPKDGATFRNGTRLVLQPRATDLKTFESGKLSLAKDHYKLLVHEMQLPPFWIETTAAVGPFFWWTYKENGEHPLMQLVFRKSDVKWETTGSRGWEMALSYSFDTRIVSGFAKGTESAGLSGILTQMSACASSAAHPLLLPVLMLNKEISTDNDQKQRELRHKLRKIETDISNRYSKDVLPKTEQEKRQEQTQGEHKENCINLDTLSSRLTNCHCEILWKSPLAWQGGVKRLREAAQEFWLRLPGEQKEGELERLHYDMLRRLDFISIKLDGLESYTKVSVERLNLQRDAMSSIISHRESRINVLIAVQQQLLADSSTRDSLSMKTLSFLGMFFLPSTFLASLFSMPFFDFSKDKDMNGPVSKKLWIYFAIGIPLTVVIVGLWFIFDRQTQAKLKEGFTKVGGELYKLEELVAEDIYVKKNVRVETGILSFPVKGKTRQFSPC